MLDFTMGSRPESYDRVHDECGEPAAKARVVDDESTEAPDASIVTFHLKEPHGGVKQPLQDLDER